MDAIVQEKFSAVVPKMFNVATYMLDRHIEEGRGGNLAIISKDKRATYQEVFEEVNRFGNVLLNLGVEMENRVLISAPDSQELICSILAAMKIGAVPIVANFLLPINDIIYIFNDSRARVAVVHENLAEVLNQKRGELKYLRDIIVIGENSLGQYSYEKLVSKASNQLKAAETSKDDSAVWQYSSGTTGEPKGIIHMHKSIVQHFRCYAEEILQITGADRIFSIAKLYFGYGQANSLYWPFCAGGTSILLPDIPSPEAVAEIITKYKPTVFCGVPTSYNAILQLPKLSEEHDFGSIRVCTSAGEALPTVVYERWLEKFGIEIIDGIGSTECFHIFSSNRLGNVVPGSLGRPIPGYEVKIVDDEGQEVPPGEIGNLMVAGSSNAYGYWNKHEMTQKNFHGRWIKTGDKGYRNEDGILWFVGRSDDMIKAGGIWVSPIEVEGVLNSHEAVSECVVVGAPDDEGLHKPKAFVVLKEGWYSSSELTKVLQDFVKSKIAHYKYPRWIKYVNELPKTPSGKLQRYKLR
ncbi:MAG: benzoate-CoA ligase family protein [Clostridia bacterium]|nr:benzoate-CoA ligase family protein [Clostridia bacterium]